MANTDKPDGFTPAYHMYGGVIRPARMRIASATDASIFSGDVVTLSSGYVIQGTADYLLNRDWVPVEAGDFMWLRAFCPQACIATGQEPFRYLLYKDVNRHMPLSL